MESIGSDVEELGRCGRHLLLFSAAKVLEVVLSRKDCGAGNPRMLSSASEDSSVSLIVCVFYQYLSVTSLGPSGNTGKAH